MLCINMFPCHNFGSGLTSWFLGAVGCSLLSSGAFVVFVLSLLRPAGVGFRCSPEFAASCFGWPLLARGAEGCICLACCCSTVC